PEPDRVTVLSSATPTKLLFPPTEGVPLNERSVPTGAALPATIVLDNVAVPVPEPRAIPPPSRDAWLLVMVLFSTVSVPVKLDSIMPPPSPAGSVALLPEIVLLRTVMVMAP